VTVSIQLIQGSKYEKYNRYFSHCFFISGCDSNGFLEKIGLKEKITTVTQTKNGLAHLPNSGEPFTGKYVSVYLNGQKKTEINYKEGKRNEFATGWYENGQKESETNFKAGNENGLATEWYENGQKQSETNFKDGKRFGLTTVWDENGHKETESNYGEKVSETDYKDQQENGLASGWYENGPKKSETNYENRI
jgi:antitoxin component YwqK of YwqJK toxin-antitoxin module